jgi:lipopolysaccharide biosynthesis glycosyltransferase
MSTLRLACAAEGRYVRHSAVMLHSVLANRGELGLTVDYLHGPGMDPRTAGRLRAMVERGGGHLRLHCVDDDAVAGFPREHRYTKAMWYRLLLPELLGDVERVLYLDVDTLAVAALEPLWATDLQDHWIGAVTNVFEAWSAHRPAELGLAGPERYFNSGVLLMDLAAMRRDRMGERLRTFVLEHGERLLWPDQDALNVVLGERRLPLHPRWNCMNAVLAFPQASEVFGAPAAEEARRCPGIRHFEGPEGNKPWHLLSKAPDRDRWARHRRATPWPRGVPEGLGPRNVARRLARVFSP